MIMSGSSDQRSTPNQLPSRPKPQITESAMKRTSYSAQTAGDALQVAVGGRYTPPAPITGSAKNAATRSGPRRRISFSSASRES